MVPLIITLLQWEFVVTTMVIFISVAFTEIKIKYYSKLLDLCETFQPDILYHSVTF